MSTAPDSATTATVPHYPEDSDTSDSGYFPRTEADEDDLDELAEPWTKYDKKINLCVFYPIRIREILNQRYRIENKLGYGGFSTVWMAYDLQSKTDVALKIMAAGVSGGSGEYEYQMQEQILRDIQDTSHLITYLGTFLLRGDGCNHRVLVFPMRGPCLSSFSIKRKTMATRMSAAKQLLEALENLHKARIVHRDINEKNCMWGIVPLDNLSRGGKYKALSRPLKQAIPNVEGLWKQGEIVKPLNVPDELLVDTLYLGDFGLAMKVGTPVVLNARPYITYCSPERLHGKEPSFACDMWSYMCIFAQLYLGFAPVTTWANGGAVGSMVKLSGPLPKQWKGHYADPSGSLDSWYDQNSDIDPESNILARIKRSHPEADPIESQHIVSIMSRGFSGCPEKRPTATELLQDPSFKAIMDKYCS